eukprot:Blabericola_migrator_1__8784@NODE_462_length_8278_cov_282_498843_g361_i0_p1_GENE_NODE_462_length_8278_cov_282_498843_g361_i0NODE_462_length_8278_cov_282_498843_g361_i0_p1_ORF_typecomplete_len877_score121_40NUDIX/PF00293_28/5_7e16DCP2/PF05026_13/3_3e15_NODE_462_length_8278_cov_282_498843_g361_i051687798
MSSCQDCSICKEQRFPFAPAAPSTCRQPFEGLPPRLPPTRQRYSFHNSPAHWAPSYATPIRIIPPPGSYCHSCGASPQFGSGDLRRRRLLLEAYLPPPPHRKFRGEFSPGCSCDHHAYNRCRVHQMFSPPPPQFDSAYPIMPARSECGGRQAFPHLANVRNTEDLFMKPRLKQYSSSSERHASDDVCLRVPPVKSNVRPCVTSQAGTSHFGRYEIGHHRHLEPEEDLSEEDMEVNLEKIRSPPSRFLDDEEEEEDEAESRHSEVDAPSQQSCLDSPKDGEPLGEPSLEPLEEDSILTFNAENLSEILGTSLKACDLSLLKKALLDCFGRFILNLPSSLLSDHVHYHFQVQEAHWWYVDFWYDKYPFRLPNITLKSFGLLLWELFPMLQEFIPVQARGRLLRDWVEYCRTIPLRGAIILNPGWTKVLLVQGWKGGRWTFPRGKVDEQESDDVCAAREVLEEIGLDISDRINREMFIERRINKQFVKLFIILDVPENTSFGPQKRKEISKIRWVTLASLASTFTKQRGRLKPQNSKFTHVIQFIKPLMLWMDFLYSRCHPRDGPHPPEYWTRDVPRDVLKRLQMVDYSTDLGNVRADDVADELNVNSDAESVTNNEDAKKLNPQAQQLNENHPDLSPEFSAQDDYHDDDSYPPPVSEPQKEDSASEPEAVPKAVPEVPPPPSTEPPALFAEPPKPQETPEQPQSTAEALLEALLKASTKDDDDSGTPLTPGLPSCSPKLSRPRSVRSIGVATVTSAGKIGQVLRRFSRSRGAERRGSDIPSVDGGKSHLNTKPSRKGSCPIQIPHMGGGPKDSRSSRGKNSIETPLWSRKMKKRIPPACGDTDTPIASSSVPSTPDTKKAAPTKKPPLTILKRPDPKA